MYDGYFRYYYKQNVLVDISDKIKLAIAYIMNNNISAISNYYIDIIKQCYIDNDLYLNFLYKSIEFNKKSNKIRP